MRRAFYALLKFYGIFALCVLQLAISSVSLQAAESAGGLPLLFDARERIAKPDMSALPRLRFLTTVDFPPFNFIDQSGRLAGFHVDLVREICQVLKIEPRCQIQALPFAELQPALEEGQGEAVVAGIGISPELRQRFAFSRAFMKMPARFAASRQAMGPTLSVAALAGKPVGVVSATTHEAMLKAFFPKLDARTFPSRQAMLDALGKGSIAAAFSDAMQLSFWVAGRPAAGCCVLLDGAYFSQRFLGEGLAIMTRKNEASLNQAIDHALLELSRNGRLNEIYLRYFPAGIY
jgi:polar amino acid transport system substrate-binding protein